MMTVVEDTLQPTDLICLGLASWQMVTYAAASIPARPAKVACRGARSSPAYGDKNAQDEDQVEREEAL